MYKIALAGISTVFLIGCDPNATRVADTPEPVVAGFTGDYSPIQPIRSGFLAGQVYASPKGVPLVVGGNGFRVCDAAEITDIKAFDVFETPSISTSKTNEASANLKASLNEAVSSRVSDTSASAGVANTAVRDVSFGKLIEVKASYDLYTEAQDAASGRKRMGIGVENECFIRLTEEIENRGDSFDFYFLPNIVYASKIKINFTDDFSTNAEVSSDIVKIVEGTVGGKFSSKGTSTIEGGKDDIADLANDRGKIRGLYALYADAPVLMIEPQARDVSSGTSVTFFLN